MKVGSMLAAIAATGASACVTTRAAVTPLEIAQQTRPLLEEGSAEVTGLQGTLRVSAEEVANIHVREGDLERPMQVTVRELVGGCLDGVDSPGCLAGRAVHEPAIERQRVKFDRARAETAISFGLMGGAIGLCVAACDDTTSLENAAVVAGGVVLGTLALFLLVGSIGR